MLVSWNLKCVEFVEEMRYGNLEEETEPVSEAVLRSCRKALSESYANLLSRS
jgi:hypothetical protein